MSAPARRSSSTSRATARRVLDLGCATGTTGAALKARQPAEVVGIELDPEYAREAAHPARSRLRRRRRAAAARARRRLRRPDRRRHPRAPQGPLDRAARLRRPARTRRDGDRQPPQRRPLEHVRAPRARELAAPPRGHLRRHAPALVHAQGRAATARASRPGRPTPSSAAAGSTRAARGSTRSPRRSESSGLRTLITFQYVIAATL